jgi:hypothetical protein
MPCLSRSLVGFHPASTEDAEQLKGVELGDKVEVVFAENRITEKQRSALHVYLRQVVNALNDAGLDQRVVLKPEVEIPWTEASAKEHLWRPIQKLMTDKVSTTELDTVDPSDIHRVLDKHLAERFGISFPWPSKEAPMVGEGRHKKV